MVIVRIDTGIQHYCSQECAERDTDVWEVWERTKGTTIETIPDEDKPQHIGPLAHCDTCGVELA